MGLIPDEHGVLARVGDVVASPVGRAFVIGFVLGARGEQFATVALATSGDHRTFEFHRLEACNGAD